MRKFVLAVLFAIAVVPSYAEEACTLKRIAVIPFETDETAQIYLPAIIAGKPTRLMLDTGAYWSLIDEDLAKSLNLKIQTTYDMWLIDVTGEKTNTYVTVPEMKLGDITFSVPIDFFTMHSTGRIGGLLGLNFFAGWDLEIDNAGKTISFFMQDHCEGAGVHWADEAVTLRFTRQKKDLPIGTRIRTQKDYEPINMPLVGADLEGEEVRTLFNTGATVTSIDLDHAKRRFGIGPGSPGVEPAGVAYSATGKAIDFYSYTFKSLTISGIRFENVPVHLGKFERADLILGMHELKYLHLYFAFKDGMIHITAADAGRPQ